MGAVGALLLTPTPVDAKIYKCVSPSGSVSYSQSPCSTEAKVSKVLQGKSVKERFDCRVTRAFSTHVAEEMKAGVTLDDLLSHYGGVDAMSDTAVSVLNYVYDQKDDANKSVNGIAAQSGARCETGTYSQAIDCEHYPASFIDGSGGCAMVKGEAMPVPVTHTDEPELEPALPVVDAAMNTHLDDSMQAPANYDRSLELKNFTVLQVTKAELQSRCRVKIRDEITAIQTEMRKPMTLDERNVMNEERSALREQFEDC